MITEFCIGDSFGRPFEFNTPEFTSKNAVADGYKHRDGEDPNGIGIYTDDTQMTLAVAECMLDGVPITTQIRYAHHFMSAYNRDRRGGYSKRMMKAFDSSNPKFPFEFIIKNGPVGFKSNGCVMRTLPVGLYPDPKRVIHECMVHAPITHGSMEALNATVTLSLSAHYFYHVRKDFPFGEWGDYFDWMKKHDGNFVENMLLDANEAEPLPCDAGRSAAASIKMAMTNRNPKDILEKSVTRGGDVDTLAAVAMGLSKLISFSTGPSEPIPQALVDNLENGSYGRDYIKALDDKLYKAFPRNS